MAGALWGTSDTVTSSSPPSASLRLFSDLTNLLPSFKRFWRSRPSHTPIAGSLPLRLDLVQETSPFWQVCFGMMWANSGLYWRNGCLVSNRDPFSVSFTTSMFPCKTSCYVILWIMFYGLLMFVVYVYIQNVSCSWSIIQRQQLSKWLVATKTNKHLQQQHENNSHHYCKDHLKQLWTTLHLHVYRTFVILFPLEINIISNSVHNLNFDVSSYSRS